MSHQFRINPSINFSHYDEAIYQGQAAQYQDPFQQSWNFPGTSTAVSPTPSPTGTVQHVPIASPRRPAIGVSSQQSSKRARYENIDPNLQDPRFLALPGSGVFPAVHNHAEPSADPLTRFYQGDEPWNPIRYSNANVNTSAFGQPQRSFGQNRPRPCSDFGSNVPASDSGYYTHQTKSVLSGELGRVQHDLPSDFLDRTKNLAVECSPTGSQPMVRRPSSHGSVSQYSHRSASQKQHFPCPEQGCEIVSKCQSEHKKHMLKHHKEFKCDILGCKRENQGFSTSNDLDRHKKSVHKIGMENSKSWRCAAASCSDKGKIWPRLDNFKQHIERMHRDDDLIDLIRRSEYYPQDTQSALSTAQPMSVDPSHLLAGMVTEPSMATEGHHDFSLYPGSQSVSYPQLMSLSGRSISTNSQVSPGTDAVDFPFAQSGSSPATRPIGASSPAGILPTTTNDLPSSQPMGRQSSQSTCTSAARHQTSVPKPSGVRKSAPRLTLNTGAQTKAEQQREVLALSKVITQQIKTSSAGGSLNLEELVFRAVQQQIEKGSASVSKKPSSASKANSGTVGDQGCPYEPCEFVGRKCDLNKHVKRHLKPFGCTYPKCYKRFGAKSDWKRHENSQHFQQEAYRCDYQDGSKKGEKCGQHFYRVAQFEGHLKGHMIRSSDQIQADLKRCKIGKNCQGQYWCGFCGVIKRLDRRRNEAWDERFDHIAHHFDKEKKCIDDWICVEENRTKEWIRKDMERGPLVDDEAASTDGEKEDDSGMSMTFGASTVLQGAVPGLEQTASRKRKAQGDVPVPQRAGKQQKVIATLVVFCCRCGYGGATTLQTGCTDCQHIFCGDCRAEEVPSLSFDN